MKRVEPGSSATDERQVHAARYVLRMPRQGYWNGARPPIGHRMVAVETRGSKIGKRWRSIRFTPKRRLIFRLALEGADGSGPMGRQGHHMLSQRARHPHAMADAEFPHVIMARLDEKRLSNYL
jgi:hypothetical protein